MHLAFFNGGVRSPLRLAMQLLCLFMKCVKEIVKWLQGKRQKFFFISIINFKILLVSSSHP